MDIRSGTKTEHFDAIVIGAGPGGAVVAAELAREGRSVLILERHEFPRYHIGESLTGTAGDLLKEYGFADALSKQGFPPKSGVKVIGKSGHNEFFVPVLRPTWQVRRSEFDHMLLDYAVAQGAELRYGSAKQVLQRFGKVLGVGYRPSGSKSDVLKRALAPVTVDCSGHSAVFSKHGVAGPRRVDAFGRQIAVFSQFKGPIPDLGEQGQATVIFYAEKHHWAWFIPLSAELVSVGVVIPNSTYKSCGDTPEEVLAWGLRNINPELARRVTRCEQTEPVRCVRNYSYRIDPFVGDGWLCVGDSHRFADPIFSFGVAFAMTEGRAAARAILKGFATENFVDAFAEFAAFSQQGQGVAYDLIRYFWRFPAFFSFQLKGRYRDDLVRLFAGDCFAPRAPEVMQSIRASLASNLDTVPDGRPRAIAARVVARYADFQGVEAAYIKSSEDGILLSFVTLDDGGDLVDSLHDFEDSLYQEFGRSNLAVMRWVLEERQQLVFGDAARIYDRRRC